MTDNVDESSGNVRVSGSTVVLTLNVAVGADTEVTVEYSSDESLRSAQSKDGDAAVASFTTGSEDPAVPAVINTTPPALGTTDDAATGNTVTVDANVSMANLMIQSFEVVFSEQRGHTGQFAVTVTPTGGTVMAARSVTRVAVSGMTVTLTIDGDALVADDSVMVTYTMSDNAGYRLKSATGAELANGTVTVTATEN